MPPCALLPVNLTLRGAVERPRLRADEPVLLAAGRVDVIKGCAREAALGGGKGRAHRGYRICFQNIVRDYSELPRLTG